ncbi:MAG: DUF4147 domain-containing protein, partial [Planctomycetes bacterium]|nr:DUF4147 domain-containing protein [Planctomycetota bacterium]
MRDALRRLFVATLADLDVPRALTPALTRFRPLAERGDALLVIAFGKAARPMATACRDALAGARLRGLVVPPEPDAAPLPPFEVIA